MEKNWQSQTNGQTMNNSYEFELFFAKRILLKEIKFQIF